MDADNDRCAEHIPFAVIALTFGLFALWGVGHRLYDTLIPQFTMIFSLQGLGLALAGGIYSISYFACAMPAALCTRRFGYKSTIVFGLGIACVGAFVLYPAGETQSFPYFITAAGVMSLGWVLLEVAANPLVIGLGNRENAVQRLNLAQSFYAPGSLLGLLVGRWLIQTHQAASAAHLVHSITHPYIVFAAIILVLAILVEDAHYPSRATERVRGLHGVTGELRELMARPLFLFAVVAQGFSVIVLASTWTVAPSLFRAAFPPALTVSWGGVAVWSMILFGVGRFLGTGLMSWTSAERMLAAFSLCGALSSLVAFLVGGPSAAVILLAGNLFMSILWPTILGIAVRDLGASMKIGTALICMGGALGGFAHRLISVYAYPVSPRVGLLVAASGYVVILEFARRCVRADAAREDCLSAATAGR